MNFIVRNKKYTLAGVAVAGFMTIQPMFGSTTAHAADPHIHPIGSARTSPVSRNQTPQGKNKNKVQYSGRIVVQLKNSQNSDNTISDVVQVVNKKHGHDLSVHKKLDSSKLATYVVNGATALNAPAVAAQLQNDSNVKSAVPDIVLHAEGTATDPYYSTYQWNLMDGVGGSNVDQAWDNSTGSGKTVAVLDTGIVNQEDLTGQIVAGYDFISNAQQANDGTARDNDPTDPGDATSANYCAANTAATSSSWHGTFVAGEIAAARNNGKGIAGVAPNSKVEPLRVLGRCGGSMSDIADAVTWASGGTVAGVPANNHKADVINLSLGGAGSCYAYLQDAINGAVSRGVPVVVSAGNESQDAGNDAPANCNNVITVGASTKQGTAATYSNWGAKVALSAPGGDAANPIVSTWNYGTAKPVADTNDYGAMIGTSMAAPHVSGTIADMKAVYPGITVSQIASDLEKTTKKFQTTPAHTMGTGILNSQAAVALAKSQNPANSTKAPSMPSVPSTTPTKPATPPVSSTTQNPVAVNDIFNFSKDSGTGVFMYPLSNDKTTASITSVSYSTLPCTNDVCIKQLSNNSLVMYKKSSYTGSFSFNYTFTQTDGKTATAKDTITVS